MSKITIMQDVLKAIAPYQSTEQARYYLNGISFQDGLLVATDGHRCVALKPAVCKGGKDMPHFILPSDVVAKIIKTKSPDRRASVFVDIDLKAKMASVYLSDKEDNRHEIASYRFEPVDGQFPNWRRIVPAAKYYKQGVPADFSPDYLADFASLGSQIRIYPNAEPTAPMIVRAKCAHYDAFGVLMPMRGDNGMDMIPGWLGITQPEEPEAQAA